jgi:hypothetical protein
MKELWRQKMNVRKIAALGVILLVNRLTFADASYQETSQITGGTMVDQLKSISFLGKTMNNMFAPTNTLTMVHGNQKAVVSKDSTEITDLDKETITRIDTAHKTYTVTTFAQMRQAFANMPKQMEQAQAQAKQAQAQEQAQQPKTDLKTSFDVSAKNTGVTKEINGLTAQEQLVTMQMHITDPNAPPTEAVNTMTYVVTTDAWIAPDPPEVKEIQDFDVRMGKKLMAGVDMSAFKAQMSQMSQMNQNAGMAQVFGGKPGSAEAMAQMQKEIAKLKGTRVMEVTRMGGSGSGPGAAPNSAQAAPAAPATTTPANSSGAVAGQVATDTAAQTAAGEASKLGVFGSALGSSALGAFHKKKAAAAAPAPAPAATDTATATPATSAASGTQTTQSAVLMEMTTQKSNFSQETVPASAFQVPAGFKRVESPMYGAASK